MASIGFIAIGFLRRIEAGKHSCYKTPATARQQTCRPMELNGPAKRLLVDDEYQDERQQCSEQEPDYVSHQPKQSRFAQDDFPRSAASIGAEETQYGKFAATVDHHREQRACNPHHGDKNRHCFQRIGDAKCRSKISIAARRKAELGKDQNRSARYDFIDSRPSRRPRSHRPSR